MQPSADAASIVLRDGNVVTLDATDTRATAVAIVGERIVAVGNDAGVARFIGPDTRVIELNGRTVIPGFNDAHAHMDREGLKKRRLSLMGCTCVGDILTRVRDAAVITKPGEWIVTMPVGEPPYYFGGPKTLAEERMPTRRELDAVAPNHPVYIQALFANWGAPPGYSALNSAALQANGVDAHTRPRIPGVSIERDPASGEPTGVIIEYNPRPTVEFDFLKAVPRFTYQDRVAGLVDSMHAYNSVGTTSVYEGHGLAAATIAAYRELWEAGRLTVRAGLVLSPAWSDFQQAARAVRDWTATLRGRGLGDAWLSVSGVHIAWGGDARLAAIARADLPNTGWAGFVEQAVTPGEFRDYCFLLAENDIRLNTIVSDQLHEVMPIIEEVAAKYPLAARRWVIQHIARSRIEDLQRLKALGLEVTTIPAYYLWKGGHRYLDEPDDGNAIVPHRTLLDLGIPTAAATDNIPYDPFFTLWTMTERRERTTDRVIGPAQRLGNAEALRMLTVAGARLTFDEGIKGPLVAGNLADLAIISDDPITIASSDLRSLRVHSTIVGGRVVYERS